MNTTAQARLRTIFIPVLLFMTLCLAGGARVSRAQSLIQNFDDVTTLPAQGWFMQNNSVPVGTTGWEQGQTFIFTAQAGAPNSYIRVNFNSTTDTNTISNWLLTPTFSLTNGNVIKFWTRTVTNNQFPDRLEVRLSTNGASTNVGSGPTGTGDFTTVLLTVNPNLQLGGYPETWTEFNLTLSGLPAGSTSGRIGFRYFVTMGGPSGDNSNYIGIDTFSFQGGGDPGHQEAALDYNGDGKTDYTVERNTGGGSGGQVTWYINNGTTYSQTPWGISTDNFVAGDFDGDDKTDITAYRAATGNSYFYTLRSSNGTVLARQLGTLGDDPTVVGDYDGDDIDDFAVYRDGASQGQQSFWFYLGSSTPNGAVSAVQWGQDGDYPAPGDYDGDGKNDFCIQRNNGNNEAVFYLSKSGGGSEAVYWGTPSDLVVPGDYDGDGKTDFGVARGSGGQILWSVLGRNNYNIIYLGERWGLSASDFTTQGDYDGDGKTDIAVWRPGSQPQGLSYFYARKSSDGALQAFQWGLPGDYPVANFNNH